MQQSYGKIIKSNIFESNNEYVIKISIAVLPPFYKYINEIGQKTKCREFCRGKMDAWGVFEKSI